MAGKFKSHSRRIYQRHFMNTQQTPGGLILPPHATVVAPAPEQEAPQRQYMQPTVNIHLVPKNDPLQGLVLVTYDNNVIEAHFPINAINIVFNEGYYQEMIWPKMVGQTAIDSLFEYVLDEKLIPTCKYYSPSEKALEAGAVLHPDFPYYEAVALPICLHPDRRSSRSWLGDLHSLCPYTYQDADSDYYEPLEWQTLREFVVNENEQVLLQTNYLHLRVPAYRVVVVKETATEIQWGSGPDAETPLAKIVEEQFLSFILQTYGTDDPEIIVHEPVQESLTAVPVKFLATVMAGGGEQDGS